VLRQLLPQIPIDVQNEYAAYIRDPENFKPREIFERLLMSSIQEYSNLSGNPVFILIDAFDEFHHSRAQQEKRERALFLSCMERLSKTAHVKILISTRLQYRDKLQKHFPESQICEVRGEQQDIERYLDYRLEHFEARGSLKGKIKDTIVEANKTDAW
jgi:hypothetical protein